jgi:hypothetical protein
MHWRSTPTLFKRNHRRMLKRYCWWIDCHSASQQLRQTISLHLLSVLCTTLYVCICPHCHLSSRNVCNALCRIFCVQWRSMAYWILLCWFRFILNNYSTPSYILTRKKYWKVSLYIIYQQLANIQHSFFLDCLTREPREPHTQRQNIIFKKTWILKNAAERTSNVAHNNHFLCNITHCTHRCKCTK